MTKVTLLNKDYCGEGIVDIERDVSEALDENFTPALLDVELDDYSIPKGKFKVTVVWCSDDVCIQKV